jgi:hypothetical protein
MKLGLPSASSLQGVTDVTDTGPRGTGRGEIRDYGPGASGCVAASLESEVLAMTLRLIAGAILTCWAGWWGFFAFAQAPPAPIAAGVVLVLFALPLIAWAWRRAGGAVLVAEGVTLLAWIVSLPNPTATTLFLVSTLGLPPCWPACCCWRAAGGPAGRTSCARAPPSGEGRRMQDFERAREHWVAAPEHSGDTPGRRGPCPGPCRWWPCSGW